MIGGTVFIETDRGLSCKRVLASHDTDIGIVVERIELEQGLGPGGGQRGGHVGKEAEGDIGLAMLEQRTRIAGGQRHEAQIHTRGSVLQLFGQTGSGQGGIRIGSGHGEGSRVAARIEGLGLEGLAKLAEGGARTVGHSAIACGVGVTPVDPAMKRSSPVASRSRRRALLTASCVIESRSDARVTLRSVIATSKTRSRLRSEGAEVQRVIRRRNGRIQNGNFPSLGDNPNIDLIRAASPFPEGACRK